MFPADRQPARASRHLVMLTPPQTHQRWTHTARVGPHPTL